MALLKLYCGLPVHLHTHPFNQLFLQPPKNQWGIESFHFINNVLKQIIQQNIGSPQTFGSPSGTNDKKYPSDSSFRIFFSRYLLLLAVWNWRQQSILLKEALHIRHLQDTVIEILKRLIPCTGSSLSTIEVMVSTSIIWSLISVISFVGITSLMHGKHSVPARSSTVSFSNRWCMGFIFNISCNII